MNQQLTTSRQSINSLAPLTTPRPDERWLYALMLLVPESIYGWLLYSTPALRTLPNLLVITLLFGLHGARATCWHRACHAGDGGRSAMPSSRPR